MGKLHELSRADARRIAVRAQLLSRPRPADPMDVVRRLTLLQLDPTRAVAASAELVLWSRLGSAYAAHELWDAVDEQRLIELRGVLRPAEDVAQFRSEMEEWPGVGQVPAYRQAQADWVEVNNDCRRDLLQRLRTDGPLRIRDLPDSCVQPWSSSGWNNNRNVTILLGFLVARGEVAAAGGTGRDRLWDLAARVYPDDPAPRTEQAQLLRAERWLRAMGIARPRPPASAISQLDLAETGEPATVEGTSGEWRVDPAQLGQPFSGRAALLSPFDQLVADRGRMADLFEFDYFLEMYKPEAKRRWGYYALPILYADRLVGKLDARADRRAGVLRVHAVHQDVPFSATMQRAVDREVDGLARWLDLELERSG